MNDFVWYNKYIRKDAISRIYKKAISPMLTYGAEARSKTFETKRQVQVSVMRSLTRLYGEGTMRDKWQN